MKNLRRAAVAGSWYPETPARLVDALDGHLARVDEVARPCPRAIVVPHAGMLYSGPVAAHAFKLVVADCHYGAVVVVGPSHFVGFRGVSVWPRGAWDTPLGPVAIAEDLAAAIAATSSEIAEYPEAHGREHSIEMQLPFVAHLLPGVPIVPLVMGYQTRATSMALGDAIARAVSVWSPREARVGPNVLLVASSDLSHYQDAATAARMDAVMVQHVDAFDADGLMDALEGEPHHACGGGPMVSVLRAARRLGASQAQVLRYADSGDVSGDKSSVVGYMAAAIW